MCNVTNQSQCRDPAKGMKILPDVREEELKVSSTAGGRAAGTPKTTRSFNRTIILNFEALRCNISDNDPRVFPA
jgi:hypothetical protein